MEKIDPEYNDELRQLQMDYLDSSIDSLNDFIDVELAKCRENFLLADIDEIFRLAHSLKGTGGSYGFDIISHMAAHLEDVLSEARNQKIQLTEELLSFIIDAFEVILNTFYYLKKRCFTENIPSIDGPAAFENYCMMLKRHDEISRRFPLDCIALEKAGFLKKIPRAPAKVSKNVILAYSNNLTKNIIKSILEQNKYTVRETKSGIEALAMVCEQKCDLLITFNVLEKINGEALCAAVKLTPDISKTPIMLITSNKAIQFSQGMAPDYFIKVDDNFTKNLSLCIQTIMLKDVELLRRVKKG